MKIWILYENEQGMPSGTLPHGEARLFEEGRKMGLDVEAYMPDDFELFVDSAHQGKIFLKGQPVSMPDILMPRVSIKDRGGYVPIAIIRHMERAGVRILNSASSIETVADKFHTHQILLQNGIPTPPTLLARFPIDVEMVENQIGFPVVVKTLQGTCGAGVFLARDRHSCKDIMELIGEMASNVQVVFQKFVGSSHGRDLRLLVCGGRVIAAMERRAADGGFKANFSAGGSVQAFVPDRQASEIAVKVAKVLGLEFAGIDLLFDENGKYTVCEANAMPGFKGIEQCCNINVPEFVYRMLLSARKPSARILPFGISLSVFRNPFRQKIAA